MKASEILRKLADMIDAKEDGADDTTEITNRPGQNEVDIPTDAAGVEAQAGVEVTTMVPPLQQKLELLKKSVGVANAFDDESCQPDDLDVVKKNAGLPNVVAIHTSAEDNDITG
jgi:hypothetical protein